MKAVILFLFICMAWVGEAQKPVSYTSDSLKKGDYLTIEVVHYYPETGPGMKEQLPWRAENIRRLILKATVTESSANELTVGYTLESVYDCRNDSEKPGFYLFDSRYQKDRAFKDNVLGKQILSATYDRKSGKVLASEKAKTACSYSKAYVPFGVKQGVVSSYPEITAQDSLDLDKLLAPLTKDFQIKWENNQANLSIPGARIIGASFELPPNTEFACTYFDIQTSKDSTIHKKIFIPYPTEYEVRERTVLLLTPGDSVVQHKASLTNQDADLFQGRGSEQNNFRYQNFRSKAYAYEEFDTHISPDQRKKVLQLRESLFQDLKKKYENIDPYWLQTFERSEQYAKSAPILLSYLFAEDKVAWKKSGLLDWQAPYFASVNPLIDFAYSLQKQGVDYYNYFLNIFTFYKKAELKSDNLCLNKWEPLTPQENYFLIKQVLSGYPQYLKSVNFLKETMNYRMLSEIEEDYNDFITSFPDTSLSNQLKNKYNKLLPLEAGNNIRKSGLIVADSLTLVKGSDRKYILLYLSTGTGLRADHLQNARDFEKHLQEIGLGSTVKLELYARFASHHAKAVKPFKAIPEQQLQYLNRELETEYMTVLMREDGTILHRQYLLNDTATILNTLRKDMAEVEQARTRSMKDYGKGMLGALLIGGIIGSFVVYVFNTRRKREQHRRQICELELRAIRSQMNPHFIFNALSSIQNLISRAANDEANEYLVNFSRLLRKVLATSEKKLVPLSDEIEQIQLYLKLEQLRFPFTYSLTIDENIQPDLIEIPGMLIQPFVENAVKHGIAPRGKGEIDIRLSLQNQLLVIRITDDGPGIDAGRNDGFGIRAISSQFEILKTIYKTEIDIRIENRPDTASGCRVTLSIPL